MILGVNITLTYILNFHQFSTCTLHLNFDTLLLRHISLLFQNDIFALFLFVLVIAAYWLLCHYFSVTVPPIKYR